ncbi:MAG: sigma-70 family RNA polymerase sigma factor [Ignavibacteriae bacterium]|nr:sigma-70 family RNA polymerase sigma factor [Ignavibacteriota bacterium]
MPLSDSEIIENIRRGATHHYARLIDSYKEKAMTLAVRMLKNREDAEETIQDAFIRAYNALDKFEGASKFSTWFYRIVYNTCLTKLGQRRKEFESLDYEDEKDYGNIEEWQSSSVLSDLEVKDMVIFIKKAIDTLPAKYGTILSLFYFQELSHNEICDIMDVPVGTVKTHLFRARALLQERLAKELQQETMTV